MVETAHDGMLAYLREHVGDLSGESEPVYAALRARACLTSPISETIDRGALRALIADSKTDPDAFDAVFTLVEWLGKWNKSLPVELTTFVLEVMRGERRRPMKRGPRRNRARDWRICMAVYIAHERFGLHFTRNDATASVSACDIVADCLGTLGLKPDTYPAVAKVWEKRVLSLE